LPAPRLVTWAAKGADLARLVSDARQAGISLGPVAVGGRMRPDGVLLAWQFTEPHPVVVDGLVPFFIDWGTTPHPSESAAAGARITHLRAIHPDAARVRAALHTLRLDVPVNAGATPALIAAIDGPKGRVELR
jgi:hypothetical protein